MTTVYADASAADDPTHTRLVERLDEQVRAIVRRDGVDPQRDASVVRRIAHNGRHELTNLVLTQEQVSELVERMLKRSGRRTPRLLAAFRSASSRSSPTSLRNQMDKIGTGNRLL